MKGTALLLLAVAAAAVAANQCPAEQETDWEIELLLRHEDCNKFYKCTYGEPIELDCAPGLWFNLDTWQCDWKENVDCSDRNVPGEESPEPEPEEEVAPEPETEEEVAPEPEEIPEVVPEFNPEEESPEPEEVPEVVPEFSPEEESHEPEEVPEVVPEFSPEEEEPEPEEVPEVVPEFSPEEDTEEEDVPEESAPETEEVVDPEDGGDIEFLENGCPVDPHVHWLLPHEDDCNLFYYCDWGGKKLRQCSSTLHFNRVKQVCDWSWDAGCTLSANKHYGGRQAMIA